MREIISRVPPSDSSTVTGAFIALSLVLVGASTGFAAGIFLEVSTPVLGTTLAIAFASLAGMTLLYHRLFHEHRIIVEYDEDLW